MAFLPSYTAPKKDGQESRDASCSATAPQSLLPFAQAGCAPAGNAVRFRWKVRIKASPAQLTLPDTCGRARRLRSDNLAQRREAKPPLGQPGPICCVEFTSEQLSYNGSMLRCLQGEAEKLRPGGDGRRRPVPEIRTSLHRPRVSPRSGTPSVSGAERAAPVHSVLHRGARVDRRRASASWDGGSNKLRLQQMAEDG